MALAAPSSYVQAAGLPLGGGLPRGQGTPRQGHLRTSRGLGDVEMAPGSSNSNTQLPHLAGGSYGYHVWLRGRAPPTVSSRPPPSSRLGQAPGAFCAVHTHPGVVGFRWSVVAHVPRPHCPAARTGCVLWRRKFPAAKRSAVIRYTIHPHNFIKMMQQNPPQPKACCVRPAGSAGPQGPRLLVLVGLSIASAIGLCVALRRRWRSSVRTLVVHQQCLRSMPHTPIGRAFCGACHSKSRRCKTSIRPSFPD